MTHDNLDQPEISAGSIVYEQPGDCCGNDDYQFLEVEIADGGGGKYLVLKTERWHIDNISAFAELLKSVMAKFDVENQCDNTEQVI